MSEANSGQIRNNRNSYRSRDPTAAGGGQPPPQPSARRPDPATFGGSPESGDAQLPSSRGSREPPKHTTFSTATEKKITPRAPGAHHKSPPVTGLRNRKSAWQSRDPTADYSFQTTKSTVKFQSLDDNITEGNFQKQHDREVEFSEDTLRELPETSRLSHALTVSSTLPMAQDNDRFFGKDGNYWKLLDEAHNSIKADNDRRRREPADRVGFLGWLWRWVIRLYITLTIDPINRLRYTRGIQEALPFQPSYESFILGGLIGSFDLDQRRRDGVSKRLVFKSRNASRVMMQNYPRWDRLWHWCTQMRWNRTFDLISLIPIVPLVGNFGFPGTENNNGSRDFAIGAILRPFFEGSWITRQVGGLQGLVVLDKNTPAQNLAAEGTGLEIANRSQYGTYFGRMKTNDFRLEHRLPTDESIVRTFIVTPGTTMVNNGFEHVMRCLANHWKNMLFQENGNFGHQRQEQLNPFEIMRFHMPIVLLTLTNLRGRSTWDSRVLAPFMRQLQSFNPAKCLRNSSGDGRRKGDEERGRDGDYDEISAPCDRAKELLYQLRDDMIPSICAGVATRIESFTAWVNALIESCDRLREEAQDVKNLVATVDMGIRIGYKLLKQVNWEVPPDSKLNRYVMSFLKGDFTDKVDCSRDAILAAVDKLAPKDYRMMRELVTKKIRGTDSTKLLVGRTVSLLKREIRRESLNKKIQDSSRGRRLSHRDLKAKEWYWINTDSGWRIFLFKSMSASGTKLRFTDVDIDTPAMYSSSNLEVFQYLPVAEAISRAQKVFMTVELDHGTKFSYNAFMDFGSPDLDSSLRTRLRRLISLVQLQCSEMDKARLNVLSEIKKTRAPATCAPQSTAILGGGPTGLLIAIHAAQSVIQSGGVLKVYESRDAYDKGGATFERAQIVRLDSRWIAMMRYHLGTAYEDFYVSLTGETDPHLGNTVPGQGFVEVTIKRLEIMMLDAIVALHSRGLIRFFTASKVEFDIKTSLYHKKGKDLKEDDLILLKGDQRRWKVKSFQHATSIQKADQLVVGQDYDLLITGKIQKFVLGEGDKAGDWFVFIAQEHGVNDRKGSFNELPTIFEGGRGSLDPESILLQTSDSSGRKEKRILFKDHADVKIQMDFTTSHVIISAGKPQKSEVHFKMSSTEPYGVCCVEGLQVSKGMHRFGQTRWGHGIVDDIRSPSDPNTRLVGDFTKTIKVSLIVKRMCKKVKSDVWRLFVGDIPAKNNTKPLPQLYEQLLEAMPELLNQLPFRRDRLQTRFFELGDNYYLGMELPREYDAWKTTLVAEIAPDLPSMSPKDFIDNRRNTQRDLFQAIDMMWFESSLDVMATGDVFNPGGRPYIPSLRLPNSPHETKLGTLLNFNSFGLDGRSYVIKAIKGDDVVCAGHHGDAVEVTLPGKTWVNQHKTEKVVFLERLKEGEFLDIADTFDIVEKKTRLSLVRNSSGYVTSVNNATLVRRRSDLSRSPDGYSTSKVAIATFPVAHSVCHRCLTARYSEKEDESFITAFVGDAQSSPHFMRYSGLTGAGINAMAFNNMVAQAVADAEFDERAQRYSFVTNWSNGEVVERGMGANYGEDGFLRPQFSYDNFIDYLFERALEFRETNARLDVLVTRDWKTKFASGLIPRGLETNAPFRDHLVSQLEMATRRKFEAAVEERMSSSGVNSSSSVAGLIKGKTQSAFSLSGPRNNSSAPRLPETQKEIVEDVGITIETVADAIWQIIDHSVQSSAENRRVSSQLFTQPKPTDSIYDDFAVEAQNFANGLTQGVAFATGALSLSLVSQGGSQFLSIILGILGISSNFGTLTNVSRYKNRNEEFRKFFFEQKLHKVKKGVFSLIDKESRGGMNDNNDPFLAELDGLVSNFKATAAYYGTATTLVDDFQQEYRKYRHNRDNAKKTVKFMKRLVSHYIPEVFYDNSYLQDRLVNIYKVLHEMLRLSKQAENDSVTGASDLLFMLQNFEPKLENSLERGAIRHGFLKHRPLLQTSLFVSIRFLISPVMPAACGNLLASTGRILKKAESIRGDKRHVLIREIRDLKELHFATKESQVASMMFFSASIGFLASLFFTIFRIISAIIGEDTDWVAFLIQTISYGAFGSLLGALLAFFHFIRKIGHLFRLSSDLRGMSRENPSVRRVRRVAFTQIVLTAMRLLAVTAACVGLPWNVLANNVFDTDNLLPRYVALGAVGMVILSVLFFFVVEFGIRYNLTSELGPLVCQPFAKRIRRIHEAFRTPQNGVDNQAMLDIDDWEYTAREFLHLYRFDTVFAADRFGSIQQWIQSGQRTVHPESVDKPADDTSVSV